MKKIIIILFAILSINAFSAVEFHCWENEINQNCTTRKAVNLSGFDSNITDSFNSNWYYTYQSPDTPPKHAFVFYNDEIWEDDRQKFSTFMAVDNGLFSDIEMTEGSAFYQHVDAEVETDTGSFFKVNALLDFTIYAFVGETKLNLENAGGEFTVSKEGQDLSSIRFGSNTQSCEFSQTGEILDDGTYQFSLNFSTCPVSVTAVDPLTNTSYQYTSDFSSLTKTFICADDENTGNEGEVERELFNANGNQIGYVIFDFFTNKFKVVDLDKKAFTSVE